jgi:hypothetical protein
MSISAAGLSPSSIASKVYQRLGRLSDKLERALAKAESNPEQAAKAAALVSRMADGILNHPKFPGDSLILTAMASPNLNFGQAVRAVNHPVPAPQPEPEPAPESAPVPDPAPVEPPPEDATLGSQIDVAA